MSTLIKIFSNSLVSRTLLKHNLDIVKVPVREKQIQIPKKRHPSWLPKQNRVLHNEHITTENNEFVKEFIQSKYDSPLNIKPIEPITNWKKGLRRTGLIAKKIGVYPIWLQNGKKVNSTLLQIIDNQVIKYIAPEDFFPVKSKRTIIKNRLGSLVVGAESSDPQLFRKEYCKLFEDSGVMPKRIIMRFMVSPEAALQPGTPLYASHFKPGEIIDIRAKTIDRGFQGVMKRWGFKGMPASHGVTKTHRRPGNIGCGGKMARVMPGTKLPGHMGNRWRTIRGYRVRLNKNIYNYMYIHYSLLLVIFLKETILMSYNVAFQILRVNTKYNVIWVMGHNIPGETNTFCYLYDTVLPTRKLKTPPYFPTYLPDLNKKPIPEDLYADDVHPFKAPTIQFSEES
uniref:39S ribosomal protein L3, mitochondrial isoform X1 n=1 Tax=Vespula vulgaris TaxID=7454 RepID=UPI00223BE757|nr:39S ribosomal protein L3, mitochondrial isoform X1 [Vespula vulgaris]XP_050853850.1 39S ribosomal protein L3, mitochondrial isoform X1 [Vespula vulgaris]